MKHKFITLMANPARYLIVGFGAWLTHISIAWGVLNWVQGEPAIASGIGFAGGFIVSFLGHHWWTFRSKKTVFDTFSGFSAVALFGLLANAGGSSLMIRVTGWPEVMCIAITAALVPVITYFLLKYRVFN